MRQNVCSDPQIVSSALALKISPMAKRWDSSKNYEDRLVFEYIDSSRTSKKWSDSLDGIDVFLFTQLRIAMLCGFRSCRTVLFPNTDRRPQVSQT